MTSGMSSPAWMARPRNCLLGLWRLPTSAPFQPSKAFLHSKGPDRGLCLISKEGDDVSTGMRPLSAA
jgi:hypothetical protein